MDQIDSPDAFLTVAEVAGILKLNQQTVRNWIDQGSLPALRVGRRVRIRRSDFERILADGYTGPPAAAVQDAGPTAEDFWGGEVVGFGARTDRSASDRTAHDGVSSDGPSSANPTDDVAVDARRSGDASVAGNGSSA